MQDLNDLMYFAKVVEKGGFAAAGRALDIPKSRLSRRIAGLETQLGVRLLQRTTRKLALTDIGKRYYEHCQAMLAEAAAADAAVASVRDEPRGRVKVSCPVGIVQFQLGPLLPEFMQRYPGIQIELMVTNRRVDLIEEGVDIALRVREESHQDPNLVTRRLARSDIWVLARPSLLAQFPPVTHPDDLARFPALVFGNGERDTYWRFTNATKGSVAVRVVPVLQADDFMPLAQAMMAGSGIAIVPEVYCVEEVRKGDLVRLLDDWMLPTGIFHAVYPSRRGLIPSVRLLLDFLAEKFGHQSMQLPGPSGEK
ncbi:LysR substrate-binding domain-containing protein [Chitinivorax sp. B]|uniref:LysR substrate-binding domain-containing protein n=1 Tax=Chitinivorax sp. B TaxID=2502235 RepID=UPI0010F9AB1E|nr:LysR substrate-binding domain-containing protein [Chitinivorax sp. B]